MLQFTKIQMVSQTAPMVVSILLFFSLKNKRYCHPAGIAFPENARRFASKKI